MSIANVVTRLSSYIADFDSNRKLTDARKAGEAFCRIILLNSEREEVREKAKATKFNVLIDSLTENNLQIPKSHLNRIKSSLSTIQNYGNTDSHDNDDVIDECEIEIVRKALDDLIQSVFNSKEKFYLDQKIPGNIYLKIHKSFVEAEDWRCDKIVSIVYPNRNIFEHKYTRDFQFFALDDADSRKIGILFLARNITFKQVFETVFSFPQIDLLSTLTFLFPVEISVTTGTPVRNRKDNIVRISKEFTDSRKKLSCTFEFIEDYIWDRCLPSSAKEASAPPETPYFIDHNLYSDSPSLLSLSFIDSLVTNKLRDRKPIYVIFGDGGAGKTTFCEQAIQLVSKHQSQGLKKKAILISSFDIPEELPTGVVVDSLQSLYSLVADIEIDAQSLGLNISSGNILIIIDGLDEIQSKLKERFSLEAFIDSVKELNETYRNCSVILTSREINRSAFEIEDVKIFHIKGFDQSLIDQYLAKRFPGTSFKQVSAAREIIYELGSDALVTPLILRLICELAGESPRTTQQHQKSVYLKLNEPLDKIIYKLMDREIGKQSLGISNCDQYFSILSDVIFQYGGQADSSALADLIAIATAGTGVVINEETATNYHTSTLLTRHNDQFKIKYDAIEFLIKARQLTYIINTANKENDLNIRRELATSCYRGGTLVKEICKFKRSDSVYEQEILRDLSRADSNPSNPINKKLSSALLYIYFDGKNLNRKENSEHLLSLFKKGKGEEIKNIAIYGEFHPLDFNYFTVRDGLFVDYTSLARSAFPENRVVFKSCHFQNSDHIHFGKDIIRAINFDSDCALCSELLDVIDISTDEKGKRTESIIADLKKVFRVGFLNGSFIWKSESIYRQKCGSLKFKTGLDNLLKVLTSEDFLIMEPSKSSSGNGYRLAEHRMQGVKDFLTQSLPNQEIDELIGKLVKL